MLASLVNLKGWKAITRDVTFIYLVGSIYGLIIRQLFFSENRLPESIAVNIGIALFGLAFSIFLYSLIGVLNKEKMWRHLIIVGVIIFSISYLRVIFPIYRLIGELNIELLVVGSGPLVSNCIAILFGGLIATLSRK